MKKGVKILAILTPVALFCLPNLSFSQKCTYNS